MVWHPQYHQICDIMRCFIPHVAHIKSFPFSSPTHFQGLQGLREGKAGSARTSSHPAQRGLPWGAPASPGWLRWLRGLCWCRRGSCQRSRGSRQRAGVLPRCLSAKEVEWAWSTTNGWKLPTLSEMGRARLRGTMADKKCTCRFSQAQMILFLVFILNPSTLSAFSHSTILYARVAGNNERACFQGRVISNVQQQLPPLSHPLLSKPTNSRSVLKQHPLATLQA